MDPHIPDYLVKAVPLEDVIQKALKILTAYPNLYSTIDHADFSKKAKDKYPQLFQLKQETLDFFTALLTSDIEVGKQTGKNAMSPEGALKAIDELLGTYPITKGERVVVSRKFCNFKTTEFWDTVSELFVLKTLYENTNLSRYEIKVEQPFGIAPPSGQSKNADFAIVEKSIGSTILIDVCSPTYSFAQIPLGNSGLSIPNFGQAQTNIRQSLANKYNNKFSVYCQINPNANVAVFVSIIKSEEAIAAFPQRIVNQTVQKVVSSLFSGKPSFRYGFVFTIRAPDCKNLVLVPVAEYVPP